MSHIGRELQLTIQNAAREAVTRRHTFLTVEHLLYAILHNERGIEVLRNCGVDLNELKESLEIFFENELEVEEGEGEVRTQQTLAFHRLLESALQHASSAEKEEVEAGDLLAAFFQEPDSQAASLLHRQGVTRLDVIRFVSHGTTKLRSDNSDENETILTTEGAGDEKHPVDPVDAFAANLTESAVNGDLDPLVGRESELERVIHILARRRKNNPLFVGETGVGKTSIAEGLAQRIVSGDVPEHLIDAEIISLDLGALLAGTRYRGDFEERFKVLMEQIHKRTKPILFIDEIHSILGAGSAQGAAVDVSSLLKPLLQGGELRCMGSTTFQEFRHFEKDRALARRFQRVDVSEPSIDETVKILQGLAPRYEDHHGVRYTAAALRGAAELSARHLNDRFLPDKAIDLIDEVGASISLKRGSKKRNTVGLRDVEVLISRMAGVPILRASGSEREKLGSLDQSLRDTVFGQDSAIDIVVRAIKRARAGLGGTDRPTGSFLFAGPTGVGKTELAKQLALSLGMPFLRFDMSEYMEKHAVARLIGAPPGYVGYDEGGQLVEGIRKNPHCVVLLDEIEKAHSDLFDILLQVMDRATLTDNHGREADFRHVVVIMTTNAGARDLAERKIGFGEEQLSGSNKALEKMFSPEFRNRLDEIVHFVSLTPLVMEKVVDKFIVEVSGQLKERKISIELTDDARSWLAKKGYDQDFGARPLTRLIQTQLKDRISEEILFGVLEKGGRVTVDLRNEKLLFLFGEK